MSARWRIAAIGASALVVVAFLGLMAWGILNNESVTGRSGILRVGKPAPDFTLALLDGGELSLSQYQGRPVVVNFWASWCPPCRQEAVALERAWRAHADAGVQFIGVDLQDRESDARAYISEFDVTYPNGTDIGGKISVDYGVIGLPVTFFVSREGVVERRFVGAISRGKLEGWIGELEAGVAPSDNAEGENLDDFFEFGD